VKTSEKILLAGIVLCAPHISTEVAIVMSAVAILGSSILDWRKK